MNGNDKIFSIVQQTIFALIYCAHLYVAYGLAWRGMAQGKEFKFDVNRFYPGA